MLSLVAGLSEDTASCESKFGDVYLKAFLKREDKNGYEDKIFNSNYLWLKNDNDIIIAKPYLDSISSSFG
jgi:hypothetical protein